MCAKTKHNYSPLQEGAWAETGAYHYASQNGFYHRTALKLGRGVRTLIRICPHLDQPNLAEADGICLMTRTRHIARLRDGHTDVIGRECTIVGAGLGAIKRDPQTGL